MQTAAATGEADWTRWREQRAATVSAPHGTLALTGTHWLDDLADDGAIPGLPGTWRQVDGQVVREVDGATTVLEPEGRPLVLSDGRKVQALVREGLLAVRVWDPEAPARQAFTGIDAFGWDTRWVVPGVFRPYETGPQTVRVPNADGRARDLGLRGDLVFTVDGEEHTLAVAVEDDGRLWAVVADLTSGKTSFRFRFLHTAPPAADGSVTVDLNRTALPPCAFGDGYLCPFPPPGNTLPFALEAGERAVLSH
ncbi:DUF1684 domain-containing protein [Actinacidiphila acididurans]|uniref:DUF1684 domain-containing protein n=1 Tax=Actinacidiphila acididurans TaxID=2784346 RepID=A0ABS2TRY2_9ACTN|nr:DUF1684 domain-containing protein [Actinacidiphila acididurans]MBM9506091.1 DUF1684 domain-containing protein [Actinacidiphila acididurans]